MQKVTEEQVRQALERFRKACGISFSEADVSGITNHMNRHSCKFDEAFLKFFPSEQDESTREIAAKEAGYDAGSGIVFGTGNHQSEVDQDYHGESFHQGE